MLGALLDLLSDWRLPVAVVGYGLGILLVAALLRLADHRLQVAPLSYWIFEHMLVPALQALFLLLFLVWLLRPLYGLGEAPGWSSLFDGPGRLSSLVNWLVVLSVLAAMVPAIGRRLEWVIPVQGILMLAMLFHRLAQAQGVTAYRLWPGWAEALQIAVLTFLGAWLARRLTGLADLVLHDRWRIADGALLAGPLLTVLFQLPALAVYGHALTRQLSA